MQIHVTQEDIDKGRENQAEPGIIYITRSCPVALAATRAFKESLKPGEYITAADRNIVIRAEDGSEVRSYTGTPEMRKWILAFDNRAENLSPVTLELTLDPSLRQETNS
jgi:hypothetical protein